LKTLKKKNLNYLGVYVSSVAAASTGILGFEYTSSTPFPGNILPAIGFGFLSVVSIVTLILFSLQTQPHKGSNNDDKR
jgi:hypothetical protein